MNGSKLITTMANLHKYLRKSNLERVSLCLVEYAENVHHKSRKTTPKGQQCGDNGRRDICILSEAGNMVITDQWERRRPGRLSVGGPTAEYIQPKTRLLFIRPKVG